MPDGQVLIIGGHQSLTAGQLQCVRSAELYNPASGTFLAAGNTVYAGCEVTATLLLSGKVLITEGIRGVAELYDASTRSFRGVGEMIKRRAGHTAALLPDGRVVIVGGYNPAIQSFEALKLVELYDPRTETFASIAAMAEARSNPTTVLLGDGRVLVVGGYTGLNRDLLASAELLE
jgi:hypothetical protein